MYKKLFSILTVLALLQPLANAVTQEQIADSLERAVVTAALNNAGVMNENMLLEVYFTERGAKWVDDELSPYAERVKLHGPDWRIPDEFLYSVYDYSTLFIYPATPQERENGKARRDENGKYIIEHDELLPGREPILGMVWFNGWQKSGPKEGIIGCKMYALSDQWLITSANCPVEKYDPSPIQINGYDYDQRSDRKITSMRLNGKELNNARYMLNDRVLLLYVPRGENTALAETLNNKKQLNILAFSQPKNIFTLSAFGNFYVHTSRGGWTVKDKTKAKLKPASLQGNTFRASSSFKGTATDPFFFTLNNTEYLSAFSTAEERYKLYVDFDNLVSSSLWPWDGLASDAYYTLCAEDLDFIRKSVQANDPQSWPQIKKQLFIDQPDKAYFK